MNEPLVVRTDHRGACTLTLNRPTKLNALNTALFLELDEHCRVLEASQDIGCVVLRGAGRSFCAGADLSGIGNQPDVHANFKPGVIERLSLLPMPVIAAIHGHCYTGGLELALAADIIVCMASARFADTHGKWGLVGGWGMSARLPRRVGRSQAKRMMMTGLPIGGEEALRIGLADVCEADARFEEALEHLVEAILANAGFTNRATKRLIDEGDGLSLRDALSHEFHRHPGVASDMKERIARFASAEKTQRPAP